MTHANGNADDRTPAPGSRVAHYTIVKQIGAGGMGEVYLAEDTVLDREVALKLLPASFSADASRRARFIREAKAVAALNHPNIVTLHSVEESGTLLFLTMELVRGQTLTDLLRTGLQLDRFFAIAVPLASALAAAHQRGIAHRDLKPSNVMVTDDGRVKVLDFGIARAFADDAIAGKQTVTLTHAGHVVGTPAYMAPEQARGEQTDARSDIFSFGIVMFEMLTGQRPTIADTARSAPPRDGQLSLNTLRPDLPRELVRLVHRCLAIDPNDRYQSALDLRHGLEEIRQDFDSGELARTPSGGAMSRSRRVILAGLGVAALSLAGVGWLMTRSNPEGPTATPRFQNAVQLTSSLDVESYPSWSPDNTRVAYMSTDGGYNWVGDHDIWVAQIGSGEPINLTRHPANDRMPSWSPDGRNIAFFSDREGGWAVYTLSAIGGAPRSILPLPGLPAVPRSWSAPQWSRDGKQLFVSAPVSGQNAVFVLSLESLETTRVDLPRHEGAFCWDLSVSPDAQRFAYVEGLGGTTEVTRLWTVAAGGGEPVPLTDGRTNVWSPQWSADGKAVFYVSNRGGSMDLWQQAVARDGRPLSDAVAVTQGLGLRSAAFSADGTKLAYGRGGRVTNIWRVPLLPDRAATWADATQLTSERAFIEFLDLSPDGKLLALSSDRRGNPDLWLLPAEGGEMTPLTTDPTPDWSPRWSPDGSQIVFYAYRSGNRDIWVMPGRGGPARQLTVHPGQDRYPSWSPDGREIAFASAGLRQTMIVPAAGGESRVLPGAVESIPEWLRTGSLVLAHQGRLYQTTAAGGEPIPLAPTLVRPSAIVRFLPERKSLLYSVINGPAADQQIWQLSLADGKSSRVTQFAGRRGGLNENFTTDGKYLYFVWREDEGDIWVMDVAR